MTRGDLDRELIRLRETADAIGANLMELERDPTRSMLEHAPLQGESAARWAEARDDVGNLWQWLAALGDLLQRAEQVQASKRGPDLERDRSLQEMLRGPSIELGTTEIPLRDRALAGPARTTARCTPDDLLAVMAATFDRVNSVVAAVSEAWEGFAPRLASARASLAATHDLDGSVDRDTEIVTLGRRLTALSESVLQDPVSVHDREVAEIEAAVLTVQRDLDGAARLREDTDGRLAGAGRRLEELDRAVRAADQEYHTVVAKIAHPAVPTPPELDAALPAQLAEIRRACRRGEWRYAAGSLERWEEQVDLQLGAARALLDGCRAEMAKREQLRGLLDAYHAKAARLGRLESAPASDCYQRARSALYTAPTDLDDAVALVERYRDALDAGAEPRRAAP